MRLFTGLLLLSELLRSLYCIRMAVVRRTCSPFESAVFSVWPRAFPGVELEYRCNLNGNYSSVMDNRIELAIDVDDPEFQKFSNNFGFPCTFLYGYAIPNNCNSVYLQDPRDVFLSKEVSDHFQSAYISIVGPPSASDLGEVSGRRFYHTTSELHSTYYGPVSSLDGYLSSLDPLVCGSMVIYNLYSDESDLVQFFATMSSHYCRTATIMSLFVDEAFTAAHSSVGVDSWVVRHFLSSESPNELLPFRNALGLAPSDPVTDLIYLTYDALASLPLTFSLCSFVLSTMLINIFRDRSTKTSFFLHQSLLEQTYADSMGTLSFTSTMVLTRPFILGRIEPSGQIIATKTFVYEPFYFRPEPYCARGSSEYQWPFLIGILDTAAIKTRRRLTINGITRAERIIQQNMGENNVFVFSFLYPPASKSLDAQVQFLVLSRPKVFFVFGGNSEFDVVLPQLISSEFLIILLGISSGQSCHRNLISFFLPVPTQLNAFSGSRLKPGVLFFSSTDYGFRSRDYMFGISTSLNSTVSLVKYEPGNADQYQIIDNNDVIYTALGFPYLSSFLREVKALNLHNHILMFDFTDSEFLELRDDEWPLHAYGFVPTEYLSDGTGFDSLHEFFTMLALLFVHSMGQTIRDLEGRKLYEYFPRSTLSLGLNQFVLNTNNYLSMSFRMVEVHNSSFNRLEIANNPTGFTTVMPWYPAFFDQKSVMRCVLGSDDTKQIPVRTILFVNYKLSLEYARDIMEKTNYYDSMQVYLDAYSVSMLEVPRFLLEMDVLIVIGGELKADRVTLLELLAARDIPIFSLYPWYGDECFPSVFHMGVLRNGMISELFFSFLDVTVHSVVFIGSNESDETDLFAIPYIEELTLSTSVSFAYYFASKYTTEAFVKLILERMPDGGLLYVHLLGDNLKRYLDEFPVDKRDRWKHIIFYDYAIDDSFVLEGCFFSWTIELDDILNNKPTSPFVPNTIPVGKTLFSLYYPLIDSILVSIKAYSEHQRNSQLSFVDTIRSQKYQGLTRGYSYFDNTNQLATTHNIFRIKNGTLQVFRPNFGFENSRIYFDRSMWCYTPSQPNVGRNRGITFAVMLSTSPHLYEDSMSFLRALILILEDDFRRDNRINHFIPKTIYFKGSLEMEEALKLAKELSTNYVLFSGSIDELLMLSEFPDSQDLAFFCASIHPGTTSLPNNFYGLFPAASYLSILRSVLSQLPPDNKIWIIFSSAEDSSLKLLIGKALQYMPLLKYAIDYVDINDTNSAVSSIILSLLSTLQTDIFLICATYTRLTESFLKEYQRLASLLPPIFNVTFFSLLDSVLMRTTVEPISSISIVKYPFESKNARIISNVIKGVSNDGYRISLFESMSSTAFFYLKHSMENPNSLGNATVDTISGATNFVNNVISCYCTLLHHKDGLVHYGQSYTNQFSSIAIEGPTSTEAYLVGYFLYPDVHKDTGITSALYSLNAAPGSLVDNRELRMMPIYMGQPSDSFIAAVNTALDAGKLVAGKDVLIFYHSAIPSHFCDHNFVLTQGSIHSRLTLLLTNIVQNSLNQVIIIAMSDDEGRLLELSARKELEYHSLVVTYSHYLVGTISLIDRLKQQLLHQISQTSLILNLLPQSVGPQFLNWISGSLPSGLFVYSFFLYPINFASQLSPCACHYRFITHIGTIDDDPALLALSTSLNTDYQIPPYELDDYTISVYHSVNLWYDAVRSTRSFLVSMTKSFFPSMYRSSKPKIQRVFENHFLSLQLLEYDLQPKKPVNILAQVFNSSFRFISSAPPRDGDVCLDLPVTVRFGLLFSMVGHSAAVDRNLFLGFLAFFQYFFIRSDRNAVYRLVDAASNPQICQNGYLSLVSQGIDILILGRQSYCRSFIDSRLEKDNIVMLYNDLFPIGSCSPHSFSMESTIGQYSNLLGLTLRDRNILSESIIVLFSSSLENSEHAAAVFVDQNRFLGLPIVSYDLDYTEYSEIFSLDKRAIVVFLSSPEGLTTLLSHLWSRQIRLNYPVMSISVLDQFTVTNPGLLQGVYVLQTFPTELDRYTEVDLLFAEQIYEKIGRISSMAYSTFQAMFIALDLVNRSMASNADHFHAANLLSLIVSDFTVEVPGGFFRVYQNIISQTIYMGILQSNGATTVLLRFTEVLSGIEYISTSDNSFCLKGQEVPVSYTLSILYTADNHPSSNFLYMLTYTVDKVRVDLSIPIKIGLESQIIQTDECGSFAEHFLETPTYDLLFLSLRPDCLDTVISKLSGDPRLIFVITPYHGGHSHRNIVFAHYNMLSVLPPILVSPTTSWEPRTLFMMCTPDLVDYYSFDEGMLSSLSVTLGGLLVSLDWTEISRYINETIAPHIENVIVFLDFTVYGLLDDAQSLLRNNSLSIDLRMFSLVHCSRPAVKFSTIHIKTSLDALLFDAEGSVALAVSLCDVDQVWLMYFFSYIFMNATSFLKFGVRPTAAVLLPLLHGGHNVPPGFQLTIDTNNFIRASYLLLTHSQQGSLISTPFPASSSSPIQYPSFSFSQEAIVIPELNCDTGESYHISVKYIAMIYDSSLNRSDERRMVEVAVAMTLSSQLGRVEPHRYYYPLLLDVRGNATKYVSFVEQYSTSPLVDVFIGYVPYSECDAIDAILKRVDKLLLLMTPIVEWEAKENIILLIPSLSRNLDALMTKISLDTRKVIAIVEDDDPTTSETTALLRVFTEGYYLNMIIYNYQLALTSSFENDILECYKIGCIILDLLTPNQDVIFLRRYHNYSTHFGFVDFYVMSKEMDLILALDHSTLNDIQAVGPFFDMNNSSFTSGPTYTSFLGLIESLYPGVAFFPSPFMYDAYLGTTLISELIHFSGNISASWAKQIIHIRNFNSPTGYFTINLNNEAVSNVQFARFQSDEDRFVIQAQRMHFYSLIRIGLRLQLPKSLMLSTRDSGASQTKTVYLFLTVVGDFRGTALSILQTILPSLDSMNAAGGISNQTLLLKVVSLTGSSSEKDVFISVDRDKNEKLFLGCFDYQCYDFVKEYLTSTSIPFFSFIEEPLSCTPSIFSYGKLQMRKLALALNFLRQMPTKRIIVIFDRLSSSFVETLSSSIISNGFEVAYKGRIQNDEDFQNLKAFISLLGTASIDQEYTLLNMLSLSDLYSRVLKEVVMPNIEHLIPIFYVFDALFVSMKRLIDLENVVFATPVAHFTSAYSDTIISAPRPLSNDQLNTELILLSNSILTVAKQTVEHSLEMMARDARLLRWNTVLERCKSIERYQQLAFSKVVVRSGDITYSGTTSNTLDYSIHFGQIKNASITKIGDAITSMDNEFVFMENRNCSYEVGKSFFNYDDSISRSMFFSFLSVFLAVALIYLFLIVILRRSGPIARSSPLIQVFCLVMCILHGILSDFMFHPFFRNSVFCSIISVLLFLVLYNAVAIFVLKAWRIHSLLTYSKLRRHKISDSRLFVYLLVLNAGNMLVIGVLWIYEFPSLYSEILFAAQSTSVELKYFGLCLETVAIRMFETSSFMVTTAVGICIAWMNRDVNRSYNDSMSSAFMFLAYLLLFSMRPALFIGVTPDVTYVLLSFLVPSVHIISLSFLVLPRLYTIYFTPTGGEAPWTPTSSPMYEMPMFYDGFNSAYDGSSMNPRDYSAISNQQWDGFGFHSNCSQPTNFMSQSRVSQRVNGRMPVPAIVQRMETSSGTLVQTRFGGITHIIPGTGRIPAQWWNRQPKASLSNATSPH